LSGFINADKLARTDITTLIGVTKHKYAVKNAKNGNIYADLSHFTTFRNVSTKN